MQDLVAIRALLFLVRRELLRRRALEVGAYSFLALAASLTLWWLSSPSGLVWGLLAWASLLVAVLVPSWLLLWPAWWRTRSEQGTARELERFEPAFRDDLSTSLQFSALLQQQPESAQVLGARAELARAQIRHSAQRARRYAMQASTLFVRHKLVGVSAAGLTLSVVLLFGSALYPSRSSELLSLFLGNAERALQIVGFHSVDEPPTERPLVGQLHIELIPPAYSGLHSRQFFNSTGDFELLKGTELRFEGKLLEDADAVTLVFEGNDGTQLEQAMLCEGSSVSGSFVALHSGWYRFRLRSSSSGILEHDLRRRLDVVPDMAPSVVIDAAASSVEVTADEMLAFRIRAFDDYGLSAIELELAIEGAQTPAKVVKVARLSRQSNWADEVQLELSEMALQPKDVLVVHALAWDNDEVSSPKSSRSAPVYLRVSSPEDRHEALLRAEESMLDDLLLLLADELEAPLQADEPGQAPSEGQRVAEQELGERLASASFLSDRRAEVLRAMASLGEMLAADGLMLRRDVELFEHLRQVMSQMQSKAGLQLERLALLHAAGQLHEEELRVYTRMHRLPQIEQTERALILLKEMVLSQWMDAAQLTVNSIHERIERLRALALQLETVNDPRLRAEMEAEMARLQRELDELLGRLAQQSEKLPSEHVNAEAMKASDARKLASRAEEMRQLLDEGRIEDVLSMLDELDAELQSMLAVADQYTSAGGSATSRMDEQASAFLDSVNDLAEAQAGLEKRGQRLRDAMRERIRAEHSVELDGLSQRQSRRLAALGRQLHALDAQVPGDMAVSSARRVLEQAQQLNEAGDLDGLRQAIERFRERQSEAQAEALDAYFDAEPGSPERVAARERESAWRQMDELSQMIEGELDSASRALQVEPSPDDHDEMLEQQQVQRALRDSAGELGEQLGQMADAFPAMAEQLQPHFEEAVGFMRSAEEELGEATLGEALEAERQALRSLQAMKRQLQQNLQKERMADSRRKPSPVERVAIPEADRSAPRAFREDILEAMKQQAIPGYEDEAKLYYQSLIE
ncbi:MAG: hypothetical protein RBU37_00125 [Myxococcota bacterium]|jgi:hypothetical protein|nr:hypothetical protein [Myxococcota bacterium]